MNKRVFILLACCFLIFSVSAQDKVDINTASLAELDKITGVGPVLAQRVIDARPFSSVDDLLKVKGIGEKTLQKIKDQGLACVACSQSTQEKQEEARPPEPAAAAGETAVSSSREVGPPKDFPAGVFINEILPSPEGADETEEWIELYNSNNFDVDLSGWKIKDSAGTITTFAVPQNMKISANGYLVFKRPETKIMLNNDEDGLTLSDPNGETKDTTSFSKAQLGLSYNKTDSGWQWSATLTPGAKNIITAAAVKAPSTSSRPTGLPKTEKSDKNDLVEAGLASLAKTSSPWPLFFTTLAITLIFAALVLFIKLKLKSNT